MIFCSNNLITLTNATVNNPSTAFPIDNILSDRLVEVTQFEDNIVIDLGSAVAIDSLAIANSDKSITIEANSSDSWGAPPFSQAMTVVSGTDIALEFITQTYRYWRITASGVTKIGFIFIGNKLTFPNPVYGSIPKLGDTDIKSKSASGQIFVTDGVQIINQGFKFRNVSKANYDLIKTFATSSYRNRAGIFAQTELNLTLFNPYFANVELKFGDRRFQERYNFSSTVIEAK